MSRRVSFLLAALAVLAPCSGGAATDALPARLSDTGLYEPGTTRVRADVISYSPQYPLWSDGATKRRWLRLPAGTSIDASRPDAWEFPAGTQLWKEFGHDRPVETRYIERLADGSWRYATYVWNEDGRDARLASADGERLAVESAPNGRYDVPAQLDCLACHEGAAVPVLGLGPLQLSTDRDPHAPHAEAPRADHVDLAALVERGLLRNLPPELVATPPRIAATSPLERAALGYLHGNCGHCHNDAGPMASLELVLAQDGRSDVAANAALRTTIARASGYVPPGLAGDVQRIAPGAPEHSVVALRMKSRDPLVQMPPLGSALADPEGLALVERWIRHDLVPQETGNDEHSLAKR
jgi:hypothetical protein